MAYRPQRAIQTPPGYRDELYIYPVPGAQFGTLTPLQQIRDIPLSVERDWDWWMCSLAFSVPGSIVLPPIGFQFRDSFGNPLSDDFCCVAQYAYPAGFGTDRGGGWAPIWEPPVYVPRGGVLLLNIANLDVTNSWSVFDFELRGFKRLKVECPL